MGSGNTPRPPGQSAEPASGNTAAVEAGGSGMLSVELTAALARYQRTLARAPLVAASRAKYTAPICRDAPRGSGPQPDTGAALDVVPRGAEVRSSSGHENRGPASHRACVRCGWTDGLAGTAALTGGIRRRRGTETLGMRTCQLAAGRYGPAGCSRGSGGL